jgi:flavin reductase (DIM6/NTAB) family NADH-FMN oxidoreductase RutF
VSAPGTDAGVDGPLFREVLASFPAGVVVVTARDAGGEPAGLTVSAFAAVSAQPPLVLVCLDKGSNTLAAVRGSGAFTVNILAAERHELALLFASKRDDKFAAVPSRPAALAHGGPILHEDVAAHAVCELRQEVEAGDHWVLIGEVVEAGFDEGAPSLLYHRRDFISINGNGSTEQERG